ncbi:hypothetical protein ACLK11_23135 [Escherichia coli]
MLGTAVGNLPRMLFVVKRWRSRWRPSGWRTASFSWTFPMIDKNSWLVAHFHNGFSYWIYGCMGVLAALFMWKFVRKIKGKTLGHSKPCWEPETKKTQQTATL